MGMARRIGASGALLVAAVACQVEAERVTPNASATPIPVPVADSVPEVRPDTVKAAPPDSTTMTISLLPASPAVTLTGDAASMAERTVFAPRSQRWFMVRTIDSAVAMDIGRIDGGIGTTDAARDAFNRMVAAGSPIQAGMMFTMHPRSGPVSARVSAFRLRGRRILALLDSPVPDSSERAIPAEWRGSPPLAARASGRECDAGDRPAISAAVARYTAAAAESLSVVRGCFGAFRALIAIRPTEITPESVERVILVRANGTTRAGKLRDLSYPLHELLNITDVDADGTHEIVVRSFRPAMETWAALRMTDSITFTRFASGFTIEKR